MTGVCHSPIVLTPRTPELQTPSKRPLWCLIMCKFVILICGGVLLTVVYIFNTTISETFDKFILWVQKQGIAGLLYFMICYAFGTFVMVPAELLNIAAGYIYASSFGQLNGFFVATALCLTGLETATALSFIIARVFLYDLVYSICSEYPLYHALSLAISESGVFLVAMLRVSPLVPFMITNFMLGVTPLRLQHLLLGSLSSLLPIGCFVYLGSQLTNISNIHHHGHVMTPIRLVFCILGGVMAILVFMYMGYMTRRKLQEYQARYELTSLSAVDGG